MHPLMVDSLEVGRGLGLLYFCSAIIAEQWFRCVSSSWLDFVSFNKNCNRLGQRGEIRINTIFNWRSVHNNAIMV